jgi:hypothetical protein
VRRFILLSPGEPCDELRRAESERILRAQPYLVDARIVPYATPRAGCCSRSRRATSSRPSSGSARARRAPTLTQLRLGEQNLAGSAVYAAAEWRDGTVFPDHFAVRMRHYQMFGPALPSSDVQATRRRLGGGLGGGVLAPLPHRPAARRVARHAARGGREYVSLVRPEDDIGVSRSCGSTPTSAGSCGSARRAG